MTVVDKARKRKRAAIAALLGALLGLFCNTLPPEYRVACETVIHICTGGL